jgi:hypothetical protein
VKALKDSLQSSAKQLLFQLECHEWLHVLYSSGKICKTSLSYYLEFMTEDQRWLLHWLGSSQLLEGYLVD